ncbi:MAG: hypothetical protein LBB59_02440, partial [Campylobacteraceae bacterium]|nr:hypothetical protein [Campylobacteraceae bacterium]
TVKLYSFFRLFRHSRDRTTSGAHIVRVGSPKANAFGARRRDSKHILEKAIIYFNGILFFVIPALLLFFIITKSISNKAISLFRHSRDRTTSGAHIVRECGNLYLITTKKAIADIRCEIVFINIFWIPTFLPQKRLLLETRNYDMCFACRSAAGITSPLCHTRENGYPNFIYIYGHGMDSRLSSRYALRLSFGRGNDGKAYDKYD